MLFRSNWVRRTFTTKHNPIKSEDKAWQFTNEGIVAKSLELGLRSEGLSYQQLKDKCIFVMTQRAIQ